ncbi:MAG: hypothetical protein CFH43_00357 [Proteobacteria bacterium]|nr:MAG: hypothetical protein CFH43_00357 [Pseudomonadota bacterium]
MKNKYICPNKIHKPKIQKFMLLATSLFTASTSVAQEVPQLFKTDPEPTNTVTQEDIIESEQIIFDVNAVGRYQGSVLVRYTDDWVSIDNPNDILDQLPTVKNIESFRPLFTGKIFTNKGKSIPEVGSVQVNPLNFKINISIAAEQALEMSPDQLPTLTESTANYVSLANRLRLTGSSDFDPQKEDSLGLYHNLSLSRGGWRTFMSGNLVKGEGYDFGNMYLAHDVGRNVYSLGMLQTNGASLVGSENIYGFSIESNQRGVGDLAELYASPVDVFIPSRSKVRIYRNDTQLIYSEDLDFGLQNISTKRFPTGSYEIKIVITENNGTVTEERRFFNKSGRLTPRGLPEYSFTFGYNRSDLTMGNVPVYQLNYASRFSDNLELSANIFGIDSSFVFEPKLTGFFGNGYSYDAALSMTSNQDMAFIGNFNYIPLDADNRLTWYLRYTQTLKGHGLTPSEIDEDDIFNQNLANRRSIFSADVTYRFPTISWSLSAQRTKTFNTDARYSYGPSMTWRLYYKNGHQINAQANLTKTRQDTNQGIFINYRYNPLTSDWDYRSSVGRQNTGYKNYNQINQQISYDNREGQGYGTGLNVSHNSQQEGQSNYNTSTAYLTHDAKYAGISTNYQRIESSSQDRKETLDFRLDSDILMTQDDILNPEKRDIAVTGSRGGRSNNIIVTLNGNALGEEMDININGIPRTKAKVGEKVALSIPEYSGGEISITPSEDSVGLLDFDESPIRIKLYPGNIAQKEWTVNRVYLLSGRAVDINGKPIAWQRVEGAKNYVTTDSDGNFQMELLGNETPYVNTSKNQCVFALPTLKKEEQFVQVGDIICG